MEIKFDVFLLNPKPLRILRDKNLLISSECDEFEKLVRLRNLLVHRYWIVDDRMVYDNIKRDFRSLLSFVERLESFLNNGEI